MDPDSTELDGEVDNETLSEMDVEDPDSTELDDKVDDEALT